MVHGARYKGFKKKTFLLLGKEGAERSEIARWAILAKAPGCREGDETSGGSGLSHHGPEIRQ